jgi:geranyl-CoA carboxylase alpha subunit
MPMLLRFALSGSPCQGSLSQLGPASFATRLDGEPRQLGVVASEPGRLRLQIDGLAGTAVWQRDGNVLRFHWAGRPWLAVDASRAASARDADAASDGQLRASMNGRVVAVLVAVGDTVVAGQPMLTLEAMKMEHVHAAPCAGRVAALHVSLGEQVAGHRVVAEVLPEGLAAGAAVAAARPTDPSADPPAAIPSA